MKLQHIPHTLLLSIVMILMFFCFQVQSAETEGIDSEKIITELEKQMDLSRDKWEKLKPIMEEKSKDLSEGIKDSVDKGFAELEKLSKKFDAMSKDAEQKVKDILSSEEAMKFREQLAKIDKEAIDKTKEKMVADLNELLELTDEQVQKLKPVLEDSFNKWAEIIQSLAAEGTRNWEEFRQDFEKVTRDLYDKVKETLDEEQMKKLEEYNEEQKEDIKRALFTA